MLAQALFGCVVRRSDVQSWQRWMVAGAIRIAQLNHVDAVEPVAHGDLTPVTAHIFKSVCGIEQTSRVVQTHVQVGDVPLATSNESWATAGLDVHTTHGALRKRFE